MVVSYRPNLGFVRNLMNLSLFADLPAAQQKAVLQSGAVVACNSGEMLFKEGDRASWFYILRTGRVKIRKISPSGHEVVLHLASPPQMIGCRALTMPGSKYPADAVAVDATVALRFTRDRFLAAVADRAEIFYGLLVDMNRKLGKIYALHAAQMEPVEQRIATLLLHQALPQDVDPAEYRHYRLDEIRMTKSLVAAIVGTSTETAIRIMSRWKKKGIIESERGKLRILDSEAIYKLSLGEPPPDAGAQAHDLISTALGPSFLTHAV